MKIGLISQMGELFLFRLRRFQRVICIRTEVIAVRSVTRQWNGM